MPEAKILTEAEITEIEARANAATEGPWDWTYHPTREGVIALESTLPDRDVLLCTGNDGEAWGEISERDALFINHARTDVPALCETVRALRLALYEWEDNHDRLCMQREEMYREVLAENAALQSQLAQVTQERDNYADEVKCAWTLDDSNDGDMWETGCGETFQFTDGGPADNKFIFCYKCGKQIDASKYSDLTSVGEGSK